jgi:1-aminocyclopropane-1-carboxylate deaminase
MLTQIHHPLFYQQNLSVYLLRDDLLTPDPKAEIGAWGNKWRKLKYNLIEMKRLGQDTLITFGGAYSNHIYATANAGKLFDFKTVGIIRGEKSPTPSPTLLFAQECGMTLHYISRTEYRQATQSKYENRSNESQESTNLQQILSQYPNHYLLPEGGTNDLAIKGCTEIPTDIHALLGKIPDYICCPIGTGGTIFGIASGAHPNTKVLGFSSLKLPENLPTNNQPALVANAKGVETINEFTNYHFGGYAKTTPELFQFINAFQKETNILLDPIYTSKMMYGIYDLISKSFFPPNKTIVIVHTGGLQGWSPQLLKKLTTKTMLT